jgi:hypothetical protein
MHVSRVTAAQIPSSVPAQASKGIGVRFPTSEFKSPSDTEYNLDGC